MKKKILAISMLSCLLLASCSVNIEKETTSESISVKESTTEENEEKSTPSITVTTPEDFDYGQSDSFITTEDGYYVKEDNAYIITVGGSYTLSGTFSGMVYICVDTASSSGSYDVELDLNNASITNSSNSCIYAHEALSDDIDYDLSISALKDTVNSISDTRTLKTEDDDEEGSGAIYSEVDLKLKGKGSLTVDASYNNGIHSKDDLSIKNLTLKVTAPNNALKGNDSVTIESGAITAISTGGDGIKTSNTSLSSKGNQKGTVTIAGGTTDVYSCCDGIDAAYDALVTGDAVLNIYTSNYSTYSGEVVNTSSSSELYLCVSSQGGGGRFGQNSTSSYRYAAYFYNDDESEGKWVNFSSISSSSGMGGMGGGATSYYELEKPSGYVNVKIYKFKSTSTTNSLTEYEACSQGNTINASYNMIKLSGSSSLTVSWSTYSTSTSQGGPGSFGPGGMNGGNSSKSSYSAKGIKVSNEINITGGTTTIKSYDDALHANNEDTIESTGKTGAGNINISGGVLTLTAADDGIHADQDITISGTADITVLTAYEGIEANRIYFKGGTTDVYATDDAVNAAQCNGSYTPLVSITDGYVSLEAGSGDTDTLDSNGSFTMSGGVLIVKNEQSGSTSQTGGTIDLDGSMSVTGGIIISCGTWCSEAKLSCSVTDTSTSLSAGDYTLKDSSGNVVTSFTLKGTARGFRIYLGSLTGTYTLYRGSTSIKSFTK